MRREDDFLTNHQRKLLFTLRILFKQLHRYIPFAYHSLCFCITFSHFHIVKMSQDKKNRRMSNFLLFTLVIDPCITGELTVGFGWIGAWDRKKVVTYSKKCLKNIAKNEKTKVRFTSDWHTLCIRMVFPAFLSSVNEHKVTSTLCRAAHSGKVRQGRVAKVVPCQRYMWTLHRLGCGMPFDAMRPKNSIGKLSVPSKEAVWHMSKGFQMISASLRKKSDQVRRSCSIVLVT